MDEGSYLIPANTKRGNLILNLFTKFDLIILGTGMCISLVLLFSIPADDLLTTILILIPGSFAGFLVLPVPNYHNVLTVLTSAYNFLVERRRYIWKGWCFNDIAKEKQK